MQPISMLWGWGWLPSALRDEKEHENEIIRVSSKILGTGIEASHENVGTNKSIQSSSNDLKAALERERRTWDYNFPCAPYIYKLGTRQLLCEISLFSEWVSLKMHMQKQKQKNETHRQVPI